MNTTQKGEDCIC